MGNRIIWKSFLEPKVIEYSKFWLFVKSLITQRYYIYAIKHYVEIPLNVTLALNVTLSVTTITQVTSYPCSKRPAF